MKRLMIASATAAMAIGGTALAAPANAAPVITGGLVNVTVTDVLNNATILNNNNVGLGVAAGIAANVCDVNVGGIIGQLHDTGAATCRSATGNQVVNITQ